MALTNEFYRFTSKSSDKQDISISTEPSTCIDVYVGILIHLARTTHSAINELYLVDNYEQPVEQKAVSGWPCLASFIFSFQEGRHPNDMDNRRDKSSS